MKPFVRGGATMVDGGRTSTSTGTGTFSKGGAAAMVYVCAPRAVIKKKLRRIENESGASGKMDGENGR